MSLIKNTAKSLSLLISLYLVSFLSAAETQNSYYVEQSNENKKQRKPRFERPRFEDLDLNQDSFITLDEFIQKDIPHGDHSTVFNHIDADGNGEITPQEFESHRPPKKPHQGHKREN